MEYVFTIGEARVLLTIIVEATSMLITGILIYNLIELYFVKINKDDVGAEEEAELIAERKREKHVILLFCSLSFIISMLNMVINVNFMDGEDYKKIITSYLGALALWGGIDYFILKGSYYDKGKWGNSRRNIKRKGNMLIVMFIFFVICTIFNILY